MDGVVESKTIQTAFFFYMTLKQFDNHSLEVIYDQALSLIKTTLQDITN